jgi:hypothetical protein
MKNNVCIALSASNAWYGRELRQAMYEDQLSSVPKGEQVNHAFVVYESSDWKDWRAVDVQEKGVQPTIEVKHLTRVDYVECWQIPDVDLWEGLRACKNDLFKRYDWIGLIFGFIRLKLMSWFGWKLKKPHHVSNRLFCSEYVAKVLKKSGCPGTEDWVTANISPKNLQDYFLEHGKKVALPAPLAELVEAA